MRLVIPLGGNVIKQAGGEGTTDEQFRNCAITAKCIVEVASKMQRSDRLIISGEHSHQIRL